MNYVRQYEVEMESICDGCICDAQPLLKATDDGHEVCALEAMKLEADVNERDSNQYTALINAARNGLNICVEELIKAGADVNAYDHESYTALVFTALTGHLECMKILIDAGANLDDITSDNMTALMFASTQGYHRCVDALIEVGADVNIIDCYGHTALAVETSGTGCLEENHYRCMESLVVAGADVNIPDYKEENSGYVALSDAVYDGDARRVRLYMKAGVRINENEDSELSALEKLIKEKEDVDKEVAPLLFAAGEKLGDTIENIPGYLKPTLYLKDMCRQAVRNHLVDLDPKKHLFHRIPPLMLPDSLTRYLLCNMSLETRKE